MAGNVPGLPGRPGRAGLRRDSPGPRRTARTAPGPPQDRAGPRPDAPPGRPRDPAGTPQDFTQDRRATNPRLGHLARERAARADPLAVPMDEA